jgi:hypothetical protein
MDTIERYRCSIASPGVEVVTVRTDEGFSTVINNGPLDGEEFRAETFLGSLLRHKSAIELARQAEKG